MCVVCVPVCVSVVVQHKTFPRNARAVCAVIRVMCEARREVAHRESGECVCALPSEFYVLTPIHTLCSSCVCCTGSAERSSRRSALVALEAHHVMSLSPAALEKLAAHVPRVIEGCCIECAQSLEARQSRERSVCMRCSSLPVRAT